ncbi:MAG: hypothetical protein V4843_20520 [Pseudomonadota bacterium]
MTEAGWWMAGDVLHNPREAVVVRIGMGRKASFLANSPAIGKKSNAANRPEAALSQTAGSYAGHPWIPVSELKARLDIRNLACEDRGCYNTRAARLREETGHLMEVGDRIRCMGWVFEVLALECNRIDNVLPQPEDGTAVASSKHQYPGCSARRKPCINGCWGLMPRIFNEILKVVAQKRHIILIIRVSSPLSKIQTP